ncbi:MAG: arginyltransferase [Alphaproteobacteria bacterium]|nr:arginyltransferase [Alphaproteobacteria bacterium]MBU0795977.1 arginyltransferase [Alphaproteobacteria bacterium]MBU0885665.1 arginyltransferase [Alphaproteobacteria bacterium]MBU1812679.1 arginyltransferase [Alphaproteobacteria bacterium]MBU2089927.1 arginyltransferase [Alphaproteobacteria bacterium]
MFLGDRTSTTAPVYFFRTAPMPCPYLGNRVERRLVADLGKPATQAQYDQLAIAGFRRSQNLIYRPACPGCTACIPVRLRVADFRPSRTQRRILTANANLVGQEVPASASWEQYRLFTAYQTGRHLGGEMSFMTYEDYRDMIEVSPIGTWLIEYRDPEQRLVAVILVDRQGDGLSAVYSFYDPGNPKLGYGTFMIADLISRVRLAGLSYLYLGYWISGSQKMAYKSRFSPLEALTPDGWRQIDPGQDDTQLSSHTDRKPPTMLSTPRLHP